MTTTHLLQYNQTDRNNLTVCIITPTLAMISALNAIRQRRMNPWATLAVVNTTRDGDILRRHFDEQFKQEPGKPLQLPRRSPKQPNVYLVTFNQNYEDPQISVIPADKACGIARTKAGALLPHRWSTISIAYSEEDGKTMREMINDRLRHP
jgi:hypothetical protein